MYPATFINKIDLSELDINDYEALLKSNFFNYNQKLAILQTIDDGLIKIENSFTDTLYNIGVRGDILPELVMNKLFSIISSTRKVKLMTAQMGRLSIEQITNYLRQVGIPYSIISTNSRPLIEDDELNKNLLDALVSIRYISSYSRQDGKLRVYPRNR